LSTKPHPSAPGKDASKAHEATYPQVIAGARAEWADKGEMGNQLGLKLMAWVAVTLGRPVARLLLHPITLYFVLFSPTARRHSRRFLNRALGRPATWADGYRHVHTFASTVLDRVYFVRQQMQAFDMTMSGGPCVEDSLDEGRGAFLLGAHVGSFEALQAVGNSRRALKVAMVMYPDNARMIHSVLHALAPDFQLGIIAIGRPGSTLAIRDWLNDNGMVGLLGDRYLAADGSRIKSGDASKNASGAGSLQIPFLGVPATFTDGPLRLALLLRRRVLFMAGLYCGGRRYDVRFEVLADFTTPITDPAERERRIKEALHAYVAKLEALVRESPYNWFNFYDFWGEE
jgi:predicted LPLAT superfamily acyltransferase